MGNSKINESLIGTQRKLSKSLATKVPYEQSSYKGSYYDQRIIDTLVVIPPDGGWGWVVVAISFFVNLISDGTIYTFGLYLQDIAKSVHTEETQVATANSIMTGCYFLSGPFVSALTNKFGFRPVAVIGGLMCGFAMVLTSLSKTIAPVYVAYGVIGGLGFGMMYLPSVIILGFYFEKWRSVANSLAVVGSSLGIISFPPVFTGLLKSFTWREKFRILAGLAILCGLLSFGFRPLHPIRIVAVEEQRGADQLSMNSIYVDDYVKGKEYSFLHNLGYPTMAVIHSGSAIAMVEPKRLSMISTTFSISGPSTIQSTGSVRVSKKMPKSQLKPVREEEEYEKELTKCTKCCIDCNNCLREHLCTCFVRRKQTYASRPLYRDDIFYPGSLQMLPEYVRIVNEDPQATNLDYHMSVTRIATQKDLEEDFDRCVICSEAIKRTLGTMLDVSILKSSSFLIVCISGFFTFLGLYVPVLFVVERAKESGMDPNLASYMLSTLGVFNTIGRLLSGVVLYIPHINALNCSYVTLIICGVSTIASNFLTSTIAQYIYISVYGLNMCTVAALRHLIFIELIGLEKLTNGFGIALMFSGVSCLIGIPAAGMLKEWTGNYVTPFTTAGATLIFSALLLIPVKAINKKEKAAEEASTPTSMA